MKRYRCDSLDRPARGTVGAGGSRETRLIEEEGKAGVDARSGEAGGGLSMVSRLARTAGTGILASNGAVRTARICLNRQDELVEVSLYDKSKGEVEAGFEAIGRAGVLVCSGGMQCSIADQ